jgi:hypothetical protein
MRGLITVLLSFALGAASPSARSVGALARLPSTTAPPQSDLDRLVGLYRASAP